MTPSEFRRGIDTLWGRGAQMRAAEHWGIAARSVRRFVSGEQIVPDGIARELREMIGIMPPPGTDADDDADTAARDDACLDAIEPEMTRLRDRCLAAGWNPAEIAVAMVSLAMSEIITRVGVAAALDFLEETKAALAEQAADR